VTDAGLAHLPELTGLNLILLSDTKATDKGIAELKRALPNATIVVNRALAAAPDLVPPESDVVRFRFRHAPSRAQTADGFEELPETDCGELLYERKTGRCVYRYWYDGIHEYPPNFSNIDRERPGAKGKLDERLRAPLKGAAAFDGISYWAASFNQYRRNKQHAERIVVYGDADDLRKRDAIGTKWVSLPSWYHWAPLHALAAAVGSDAIKRDKMHHAIRAFPGVEKLGRQALRVKPTGLWWEYVVSLDQSDSGIRRVDVRYLGSLGGNYPLPVPLCYSMQRENAEAVDSEKLDTLTDFTNYAGEFTVFVE
jgi:hypothetical protein